MLKKYVFFSVTIHYVLSIISPVKLEFSTHSKKSIAGIQPDTSVTELRPISVYAPSLDS